MPLYEYRCPQGHVTEVLHGIDEEPPDVCPICRAPLVRQLSAPAVHFHGPGFHNTDYPRGRRARRGKGTPA